jgi:FixJ family two-component response regulator
VIDVSEAAPYIAVVDDEPAVCKAFGRLLRAAKFDVETFCCGADLLASMEGRRPSCVVLDLHMPDMNGFEVQLRLAAVNVQVVIITADDSRESRERVMESGASAYLRKPVDRQTLVDAVRNAISPTGS